MVHMTLVPEGEFASASGASAPSANEELVQLLKACSLGAEAAFATLDDATAARVFGLVLRPVRARAQAEEVPPDACLATRHHAPHVLQ